MGETKFKLPNEKVTLQYIKRRRGMASSVDDDHVISGNMMKGSFKGYVAPMLPNGSIKNVLTKDEKAYLEEELSIDLGIYAKDNYWENRTVRLYKEGTTLNLNDPTDYISYKILMSLPDLICKEWSKRNERMSYQFVMVREGEVLKSEKKKLDIKLAAFKYYGKYEDDKEFLIGVLKLLTKKPISADTKLNFIQAEIQKYLDENPTNFVNLIEDSSLQTKLLIQKGLDVGAIIKESNQYKSIDGLELCENGSVASFANAIKFLDNDANTEIRELIEARINNAKE